MSPLPVLKNQNFLPKEDDQLVVPQDNKRNDDVANNCCQYKSWVSFIESRMGYSQAAADRQVLRVICAYPAIEPVTYKHAVQTLLCLPSMIPVGQTRWRQLNYNSSRRHIHSFDGN